MPWADAGIVRIDWFEEQALHCVRFGWTSGNGGAILNMQRPLVGVLDHFDAYERGGIGTYDIFLHSPYDVDVLNGQANGLTINDHDGPTMLRKLLDGSDRPRPIIVLGHHCFRATEPNCVGVFDLYYWPTLHRALTAGIML